MIHIQMFFSEMGALFVNLFEHPDWRNLVDISILTVIVYHILRLVMHTRANSLFKGILFIFIVKGLAIRGRRRCCRSAR